MVKIIKKNNSKVYSLVGIVIFGIFFTYSLFQFFQQDKSKSVENGKVVSQVDKNNCLADECLVVDDLNYPVGELSVEAREALDMATNDEYVALSTYEKVIEKFGQVRPFSMIKGAEEQHIAMLKAVYDKYGLKVPMNDWVDKVSVPTTVQEACQIGVDAEIANAALYRDTLLKKVVKYEDISQVFTSLMNASQLKHLPAFERCKM